MPVRDASSISASTTHAPSRRTRRRSRSDAARSSGDEGDPAGEALGLRHALRASLPREASTRCRRPPAREGPDRSTRGCSAHHVDRVDVESPAIRAVALSRQTTSGRRRGSERSPGSDRACPGCRGACTLVIARVIGPVGVERRVEAGHRGIGVGRLSDRSRARGAGSWCAGSGPGSWCPARARGPSSAEFTNSRTAS